MINATIVCPYSKRMIVIDCFLGGFVFAGESASLSIIPFLLAIGVLRPNFIKNTQMTGPPDQQAWDWICGTVRLYGFSKCLENLFYVAMHVRHDEVIPLFLRHQHD